MHVADLLWYTAETDTKPQSSYTPVWVFWFFFLMRLDIKFSINTFSEKESPLIHCISKGL